MNTSLRKCIGINLSNPVNMAATSRSHVIEKEIETFFLRKMFQASHLIQRKVLRIHQTHWIFSQSGTN